MIRVSKVKNITCPYMILIPGLVFVIWGFELNAQVHSRTEFTPAAYPFREGDALQIRAYPDTSSFPNGVYPIGEDGYANLPFLGLTKVAGRASQDLISILQETYIEHLRTPNLQVEPLIRVACVGGFHLPGLYWVSPRAVLWEVVRKAGGPLRDDGIKRMRWQRDAVDIECDIGEMFQSKASLISLGVQSGDQFVVTPLERRRPFDIVTRDVLPVLGFIVSTVTAGATVYLIAND